MNARTRHWPTPALVLAICVALAVLFVRPAPPPPPFRVATQAWVGYAPVYLARHDGLWQESVVSVVELPTDAAVVRAMRSGDLEAGCLTLDGAFRVQAAGVDVRLIAVLDTSDGADAVVSAPGAKLARPADLRGKRVAVERYGVGMLFFCRALQSAGLTVRDVHVVNADLPQFERLFSTGRVDAAVTYSPQKERLVAAGGRVLCDSAAFPSKVTDVLVVRADAIRNNPHAARALARGWAQAADRLAADPSRRGAVARAMGIALSEVDTGYEQLRVPTSAESRALVAQERPEFLTTVRETAEALAAFGLIDERVDPARLFLTPAEMDTLR